MQHEKKLIILSSVVYAESELPRPDKWAQKISLDGVGCLYKLKDSLELLSKDGVKKPLGKWSGVGKAFSHMVRHH